MLLEIYSIQLLVGNDKAIARGMHKSVQILCLIVFQEESTPDDMEDFACFEIYKPAQGSLLKLLPWLS